MSPDEWRRHKAMLREIAAEVEAAYRSPFQVGDEVITNVQMHADQFDWLRDLTLKEMENVDTDSDSGREAGGEPAS